jgi:hypothetical protein
MLHLRQLVCIMLLYLIIFCSRGSLHLLLLLLAEATAVGSH